MKYLTLCLGILALLAAPLAPIPIAQAQQNVTPVELGPPASIAGGGFWSSARRSVPTAPSMNISLTLSTTGTVSVQRYLDTQGNIAAGPPVVSNIAAATQLNLSIADGLIYQSYVVTVTNTSGGAGALSGFYIGELSRAAGRIPRWVSRGTVPAALDFDFVNNRYYQTGVAPGTGPAPFITTTRASVAYEDDLKGNWTAFPANTLRVTNKGALIEEARTNVVRNSTAQGAAIGGALPLNWTQTNNTVIPPVVVGLGVDSGIAYVDLQFNGTVSGTGTRQNNIFFEPNAGGPAASNGQIWSGGFFYKLVGGVFAGTNNMLVLENNSAGTTLASSTIGLPNPTGTWQRSALTRTNNNASTVSENISMTLNQTGGAAINFTLRVGWPQLEQGAFVTSPIPTTNAAVTRAGDSVGVTSFLSGLTSYSLFGTGAPEAPVSYSTIQTLLSYQVTTADRVRIGRGSGGLATTQLAATGGGNGFLTNTVWQANINGKIASSVFPTIQSNSFNGTIISSAVITPTVPLTILVIGNGGGASQSWNGYIGRVALFAAPQPDSVLQALTGPAPPDVDLDFANGVYTQAGAPGTPATLLTSTRASVAYEDDLSGNWMAFPANTPRITNRGLLVEEARTNQVRNNSMQGVVPGTPGTGPTFWAMPGPINGLTQTIVGTGVESGLDYIDVQLAGTTNVASSSNFVFEVKSVIAALPNQIWNTSIFDKLQGGSLSGITSVQLVSQYYNSGGVFVGSDFSNITTNTNALGSQRTSVTSVPLPATTAFINPYVKINYGSGANINITLRIGMPQQELAAAASSPIRTTNAAVVRAADLTTLTTTPTFGPSFSAMLALNPMTPVTNVVSQALLSIDDNTLNSRMQLGRLSLSGYANAAMVVGGVSTYSPNAPVVTAGTPNKLAMSVANGVQYAYINGGAMGGTGTGPTTPTGLTKVHLGTRADGAIPANAYITRAMIAASQAWLPAYMQGLTKPDLLN